MYVLYHEVHDYDGGEFAIIAVSSDKEKLEARREQLKAEGVEANRLRELWSEELRVHYEAEKEEVRLFLERNRHALLNPHRPADGGYMTHWDVKDQNPEWPRPLSPEQQKVAFSDALNNWHQFRGGDKKPHFVSRWLDVSKIQGPWPEARPTPPNPQIPCTYMGGDLKIDEVEVL